jgi:hypothetical protein
MKGFLGETVLDSLDGTPYEGFTPQDWALTYIGSYGQIDGGHHKQWVLDQVARILLGTPVVVSIAKWDNDYSEYRFTLSDEASKEYDEWVQDMKGEYDEESEEYEYNYDEGIAP